MIEFEQQLRAYASRRELSLEPLERNMSDVYEIPRPLPPVLFLGALLGMLALHFFAPLDMLIASGWRWFGAPFVAVGIFMNIWADGQFKRAGTAVKPTDASTALVVTGPWWVMFLDTGMQRFMQVAT